MPRTLLIADDAPLIRRLIADAARRLNWRIVAEAANGREAVEQFRHSQPDVVTLDLVMPDYDGLYAFRGIRQEHPSARVVIVSAVEPGAMMAQIQALGPQAFLSKPFSCDQLLTTLRSLEPAGL